MHSGKIVTLCSLALALALARAEEAERPRIGFLGVWDRAMPLLDRASKETGIPVAFYKGHELIAAGEGRESPARGVELLFVLNLGAEEAPALKEGLMALKKAQSGLKIVPLDKRPAHAELAKADLLALDEKIPLYWRPNGLVNMRRMLNYCAVKYFGKSLEVEPPVLVPDYGYYAPEFENAFADFKEFRSKTAWKEGAPVAVFLIQQSFWITKDTKVVDAQISALRKEGMNAVTIFGDRGEQVCRMIREARPDLIVEDRHGAMWEESGGKSFLEEIDVPYLRPISMLGYTLEEWRRDPRGMSPRDVAMFMSLQESKGTLEPIVVGGLLSSIQGFKLHEPMPERVERFAKRAAAWTNLKRTPNAEKKIAIVYYNKSLGQDDLMRGSPTGAFMDGPESLVRFLPRMKEAGYRVERMPRDASELIARIRESGRNIGPWAQGDLDAMASRPDVTLLPASRYIQWFSEKLNESQRAAVERSFGPPPGKLMIVRKDGADFIAIPGVKLGNILLSPQPERGEKMDERLLHSRDVPPPHHYLAFYWWLQDEFRARAILHWGTHGSLELLPGKENGLSKEDWSDVCAGAMPIVNPWIMDNLGEATLSRRRSYALLIDHVPPPSIGTGLSDELRTIHDDIEKFDLLEKGVLKEEFRKRIGTNAHAARIGETLNLASLAGRTATDEDVRKIHDYLHEVSEARTPTTLHVLGQPPDGKALPDYLVGILRKPFLDRMEELYGRREGHPGERRHELKLEALRIVEDCVMGDKPAPQGLEKDVAFGREVLANLRDADGEISNILRALEARFVKPGPGPDPIRNPGSVPSGRNLYTLNPEEVPARASWEVAVRIVKQMLETRHPRKVGMDLSGMTTMQDFGVTEGQILYLMGVRPVWDRNNLVVDVELIPREELGRARIDVMIAMGGHYKENFTSRVKLLDKAVRLATAAKERDNLVRVGTERVEKALLARGFASDRASALSAARIFGTKPGNLSGTNILYLVPRSGVWDNEDEIGSVYIDNMSFAYTGDLWGEKIDGLYEEAIQGTDTLVRTWASNMTSQLSNHHAYEYLGGLSMAVKRLTGREAEALIADVRDPDGARMRDFGEVLSTNMRSELLNKNWIEGMKAHGYAGAGHMAELVKNTFGWSVTRMGSVSDATWNEIYETYVSDKYRLGMAEWFEQVNPAALQELASTMLESSRKGYWNASAEAVKKLSELDARLIAKHGDSGGLVTGGNRKLAEYVSRALNAPGDLEGAQLAGRMMDALNKAAGNVARPPGNAVSPPVAPPKPPTEVPAARQAPKTAAEAVEGRKLERAAPPPEAASDARNLAAPILLAAAAAAAFAYGFARRKGAA